MQISKWTRHKEHEHRIPSVTYIPNSTTADQYVSNLHCTSVVLGLSLDLRTQNAGLAGPGLDLSLDRWALALA